MLLMKCYVLSFKGKKDTALLFLFPNCSQILKLICD